MSDVDYLVNGETTTNTVEAELRARFPGIVAYKGIQITKLLEVKQRLQAKIYQTNDTGNASAQTSTGGAAESNISYCQEKINEALDERAKQAESQIEKIENKISEIANKKKSFWDAFSSLPVVDPNTGEGTYINEKEGQDGIDIIEKPLWDYINNNDDKLKIKYCMKLLEIIEDGEKYIDDTIEHIEYCNSLAGTPFTPDSCIDSYSRENSLPIVLQQQKNAQATFNSFSAGSQVPDAFSQLLEREQGSIGSSLFDTFVPFADAHSSYKKAGLEQELGNSAGMHNYATSAGQSAAIDTLLAIPEVGSALKAGKTAFKAGRNIFRNGAKGISARAVRQRIKDLTVESGSAIKRSGKKVADYFRRKCARGCA